LEYELDGPAGAEWKRRYPALVASLGDPVCSNKTKSYVPCYTAIENNTYCNMKDFIADRLPLELWAMTVGHNNVSCRNQSYKL
jgi:hypothetical protein